MSWLLLVRGWLVQSLDPRWPLSKGSLIVFLSVAFLFAASAVWRLGIYDPASNSRNADAPYHVLLTSAAYDQTPASVHLYLPVVSLGAFQDKNIPWGGAIADQRGNYYYTSFPPLGFIAPHVFMEGAGLPKTLHSLMAFNLLLHAACTAMIALLVWRMLQGALEPRRTIITALVAVTYIMTTESLRSHGIHYWPHSLFQVVWLGQLLLLHRWLARQSSRATVVGLLLLSFVAPLVEWSAYFANAALTLVLLASRTAHNRPAYGLAFGVAALTAGALAAHLAWFSAVLGPDTLLEIVMSRGQQRSVAAAPLLSSLHSLWLNYYDSFGHIVSLACMGALAMLTVLRRRSGPAPRAIWLLMLFAAAVPAFENIVLISHAIEYTFDRLKVLVPLLILLAWTAASMPKWALSFAAAAWVVAVAGNLPTFRAEVSRSSFAAEDTHNDRLLRRVRALAKPCTLVAVEGAVRGWVNLKLGRGVYEGVSSPADLATLVRDKGACRGVLLKGKYLWNGIYAWQEALVIQAGKDKVRQIRVGNTRP